MSELRRTIATTWPSPLILQLKTFTWREGKRMVQSHMVCKWQNLEMELGFPDSPGDCRESLRHTHLCWLVLSPALRLPGYQTQRPEDIWAGASGHVVIGHPLSSGLRTLQTITLPPLDYGSLCSWYCFHVYASVFSQFSSPQSLVIACRYHLIPWKVGSSLFFFIVLSLATTIS